MRTWHSLFGALSRFRIPPWLYWSPTAVLLATSFYVPMQISGRSMQPTLNPDSSAWRDVGIFDRFRVGLSHDFHRDDIVALRSPENRDRMLVKRIVGVEGDLVRTLPPYPDSVVRVPPGHVWIEGDEPFYSDDSNRFGPIPAALIDAKLVGILWPPNRFGRLTPDVSLAKNGAAYRHAMTLLQKERSRKARVNSIHIQG
ncbi:Mitochondrial inner membrane protease subunit 2 [Hypsizygus marmoreus]|uniref:Mitochondrial inner membrane protease subunit 2 n=1 Tax=Hypsizygus marmoreus TaxID=39966 RepID=A0A369JKS5_HYPMA|nr:Mitochondrial inner membrane protease subunit 2 [Hypsizygus marmoreus]